MGSSSYTTTAISLEYVILKLVFIEMNLFYSIIYSDDLLVYNLFYTEIIYSRLREVMLDLDS